MASCCGLRLGKSWKCTPISYSRVIWYFCRTWRRTPDTSPFRITAACNRCCCFNQSFSHNYQQKETRWKKKNAKNNLEVANSVCRYFILIGRRESSVPSVPSICNWLMRGALISNRKTNDRSSADKTALN